MLRLWDKSTIKVPWFVNENDGHYFACLGGYTLNVVKVRPRLFRWNVSFQGQRITTKLKETTSSRNKAIGLAEGLYACHSQYVNTVAEIKIFQSKINQQK
jgi:hypothetical protein